MSNALPNFGRGGAAAEEAAKSSGGSYGPRVEFLSLGQDEQVVVRFLTDSPDWIFVKQHTSVPTKNRPADWPQGSKWPASMPSVCRHDDAFTGIYTDCYICDAPILNPRDQKPIKAPIRVWALAQVREPVVENGTTQGYKDATRTVTRKVSDKEVEVEEKKIIVVNQAMKNFYAALQGIYGLRKTICDIDFVIKRTGDGLDTNYIIMPLPEAKLADGRVFGPATSPDKWAKYTTALEEQGLDLAKIVGERASDEYYGKFFDPRVTVASPASQASVPTQGAPVAEQQAAPVTAVDTDALEAMRARVQGYSPAASAPAAAPAAAGSYDD